MSLPNSDQLVVLSQLENAIVGAVNLGYERVELSDFLSDVLDAVNVE